MHVGQCGSVGLMGEKYCSSLEKVSNDRVPAHHLYSGWLQQQPTKQEVNVELSHIFPCRSVNRPTNVEKHSFPHISRLNLRILYHYYPKQSFIRRKYLIIFKVYSGNNDLKSPNGKTFRLKGPELYEMSIIRLLQNHLTALTVITSDQPLSTH